MGGRGANLSGCKDQLGYAGRNATSLRRLTTVRGVAGKEILFSAIHVWSYLKKVEGYATDSPGH